MSLLLLPRGRYLKNDEKVMIFSEKYTCRRTEAWKLIIENELIKSGADIIYESTVCGVYIENNTVVGVKLFTKYGFENVGCDVLFDCMGDAVVIQLMGDK